MIAYANRYSILILATYHLQTDKSEELVLWFLEYGVDPNALYGARDEVRQSSCMDILT